MESIQNALTLLTAQLKKHSWFAEADKHGALHNAIVVYVYEISPAINQVIPQQVAGWDVRVHYFTSTFDYNSKPISIHEATKTLLLEEEVEFLPAFDLDNELQELRMVCGKNKLIDIFFEVHDRDDAITNFSFDFPVVKERLQVLYNDFGFDVLWDKLDDFGNFP